MRPALAAFLLFAPFAQAQQAAPSLPVPPLPVAGCAPLPALSGPRSFNTGEQLEFDLDALGAQAGTMSMRVLPSKEGALPVQIKAKTNTFFSKVRRVNGQATSYLNPKSLRPTRYSEDSVENEVRRTAEVRFNPQDHGVELKFTVGPKAGKATFRYDQDGLDVAGAVYLMRQLPFKEGLPLCFDVYGIRRLWRMRGRVEGREHVSLPVGEFEAWHLSGTAVRLDNPQFTREVHVWISDDARRLPLAAVGAMDVGAVRATLREFRRAGEHHRAEGNEKLKW